MMRMRRREFVVSGLGVAALATMPRAVQAACGPAAGVPGLALYDPRYADAAALVQGPAHIQASVLALEPDVVRQWHGGLQKLLVDARPRLFGLSTCSDLQVMRSLSRPLGYRLRAHAQHVASNLPADRRGRLPSEQDLDGGEWVQSMRALLARQPCHADLQSWVLAT